MPCQFQKAKNRSWDTKIDRTPPNRAQAANFCTFWGGLPSHKSGPGARVYRGIFDFSTDIIRAGQCGENGAGLKQIRGELSERRAFDRPRSMWKSGFFRFSNPSRDFDLHFLGFPPADFGFLKARHVHLFNARRLAPISSKSIEIWALQRRYSEPSLPPGCYISRFFLIFRRF